jgi:hypothetical protein
MGFFNEVLGKCGIFWKKARPLWLRNSQYPFKKGIHVGTK